MTVLGIDPGLATVGWGVVKGQPNTPNLVDYGTILTEPVLSLPERLNIIFDCMAQLIKKFTPDAIAFEELFFAKNAKTAIAVAQARGAAVTSAFKHSTAPIFEYTPLQVKQALTGNGRADKDQVEAMVRMILRVGVKIRPDDAADALAIAVCHLQSAAYLAAVR